MILTDIREFEIKFTGGCAVMVILSLVSQCFLGFAIFFRWIVNLILGGT